MAKKTKDSYDEFLQFSRITKDNWLLADRKDHPPFGVGKRDWLKPFLESCLEATVPRDVIKVFEIARGSMIYSWFFYPPPPSGFNPTCRSCGPQPSIPIRGRPSSANSNSTSPGNPKTGSGGSQDGATISPFSGSNPIVPRGWFEPWHEPKTSTTNGENRDRNGNLFFLCEFLFKV
jgi:hypothetical protein